MTPAHDHIGPTLEETLPIEWDGDVARLRFDSGGHFTAVVAHGGVCLIWDPGDAFHPCAWRRAKLAALAKHAQQREGNDG